MNIQALTEGTVCLVAFVSEFEHVVTHKSKQLKAGTPVKVANISKKPCVAWSEGKCQAVGECEGCQYTVTIEDCLGEQWVICCSEEEHPFLALEEGDAEYLLSNKAFKQHKFCDFTDDGFSAKYHGPFKVFSGILMCIYSLYGLVNSVETSGFFFVAGCFFLAVSGLFFLWGAVQIVAGLIYRRNPFPWWAQRFFLNYKENKSQLEALTLKKK